MNDMSFYAFGRTFHCIFNGLLALVINLSIVSTLFKIWIWFLSTYYPDISEFIYGTVMDFIADAGHTFNIYVFAFYESNTTFISIDSNTIHSIQIELTIN